MQASRRDVLKAGGALTIALWLPREALTRRCKRPEGRRLRAERVRAHRRGRHRHRRRQARRDGAGRLHRARAPSSPKSSTPTGEQMRVEGAPADAKLYNNLAWGPFQGTGGSTSIANSYEQLRKAGATARAMLVTAAAQRWSVPASEITISAGVVQHKSGKSARFGELVADAAKLPVPTDAQAEGPGVSSRCIGKDAAARRQPREVDWHGALHAGHPPPGHADRGRRASAALRREGEELRRSEGQGDQGREVGGRVRNAGARGRRRARDGFLVGEARAATRSRSNGTSRTPSGAARRTCSRSIASSRRSPAIPRRRKATSTRRSRAPRARSRRPTSFRSSRTRRWSP